MNSHLRRAAAACLFSTVPGLMFFPGQTALAQSASVPSSGSIQHADALEELFDEPAPRGDLGKSDATPKREDFSATGKLGGKSPAGTTQKRFKRKAQPKPATAATPAPKQLAPPATANHPKSATPVDDDDVVAQTAALQSRPFSAKRSVPQSQPQAPANGDPSSSDVERELQELYRKNGREMPDMRMDDFQPPQLNGEPPRIPGRRHGQISNSLGSGAQPTVKPAKPNFMERLFGFGRAKQKANANASASAGSSPAAPQRPSQSIAPRGTGVTPPARTAQQYPPFRPEPVLTPTPTPLPPVQPAPAVREPATLNATPQAQAQPRRQAFSGLQPREPSSFLDESSLDGDEESLDLAQDEPQLEPQLAQPKQAAPSTSAPPEAGSPYTGLTITPNETERSIARAEDFTRSVETLDRAEPPAAVPAAAVPRANTMSESPKKEVIDLTLPSLEPDPSDSPLGSAPAEMIKSNADDFLELADEDDEADDEDLGGKPAADHPLTLPTLDKPLAAEAPAELDIPAPAPEKPTVPEKLPPAAKATAKPAEKPLAPVAEKPAPASKASERPAEQPTQSPPESLRGLKGFCPVILKDERRLVEARPQYKLDYRGRTYTFSSQEARMTFEQNPTKYVPVEGGRDVVRLAGGDQNDLEGTLEHAAWYRGRLYLFTSEASRREFVETPSRFMRNE